VIEEFFLASHAPQTIGRLAIGTGLAGFAALALMILAAAFGRSFGRFGDTLGALSAVLSAGLGMLLFPEHRGLAPQLASIAFGLVVFGGFIAAFGSVLAATEAASWFLAQLYVAAGSSLIGAWLIMVNLAGDAAHTFPNRAVNMGMLAGAVMILGIAAIPGILAGANTERSAPWISRYIGRAGNLGWLLLYPLWCIWFGVSRLPG
jgi:hypothetical protein